MKVQLSDIPERTIVALSNKLCVYKDGPELYAFARYCTHEGADLVNGRVENGVLRCNWHNLPFDLRDNGKQPCRSIRNLKLYTFHTDAQSVEVEI